MRPENYISFFTVFGFFVGIVICILSECEPQQLIAYTCVIALVFYLGTHVAIMNFVDASKESKIYFDKEKYEEINEFLIDELLVRERRMDTMVQIKRDKLLAKKSGKKKKKVNERAKTQAA